MRDTGVSWKKHLQGVKSNGIVVRKGTFWNNVRKEMHPSQDVETCANNDTHLRLFLEQWRQKYNLLLSFIPSQTTQFSVIGVPPARGNRPILEQTLHPSPPPQVRLSKVGCVVLLCKRGIFGLCCRLVTAHAQRLDRLPTHTPKKKTMVLT